MTKETTTSTEIVINKAGAEAARVEAIDWKVAAETYIIDTPETLELAAADLKKITAKYKEIEAQREAEKAPFLKACREIDALYAEPKNFLQQASGILRGAIVKYQEEQRRIAEEAARKAREEEEARRAEERRKAEEAKRQRQEAIKQAQAAGDNERAEALAQESPEPEQPYVPAAYVAPAAPAKVAGISSRTTWKARVTDKAALVRAILDGHPGTSLDWITVDQKALNASAKALKNALRIPGVEAYEEQSLAVRA